MSGSINKGRLCAMTLGVMAFAAGAQETTPTTAAPQAAATEQTAPDAATAAAPAAAEDNSGGDLSEVIVTARRIQERLQDVPISITVFNQDQLTDRNVSTASNLATYTPSLESNTRYGSDNASFAIRGFSQEQRTTASVGVYFADVVAPRAPGVVSGGDGAGPGSFFDLANVQVLKGPQGTLFGRNTTGGAVLLVPQKPTASFEGFLEDSIGNDDLQHTTAVVNAPLSEHMRVRFGVDRNTRDGFLTSDSGIGQTDFSDIGYTAYRLSVVNDITSNLENYLVASYSDANTSGTLPKLINCNESSLFGLMACAQMESETGKYQVSNDEPHANTRTEQWQLINTTTWSVNDNLTAKNIVSFAQLHNSLRGDLYGSDLDLSVLADALSYSALDGHKLYGIGSNPIPGGHTLDQNTFTEELQFQGTAIDDRLNWQAGGYYELSNSPHPSGSMSNTFLDCSSVYALDCTDRLGNYYTSLTGETVTVGSVGYQQTEILIRNLGIYAQSTYALTDALKLTTGLRYTADKMDGKAINGRWVFVGDDSTTPEYYCSNPDSGQNLSPDDGDPVAALADCSVRYKKSTHAPTWVIDLDYKPTDDLLLYGKWSRGYRQGGVAPTAVLYTVFDAEKVDAYELGLKSDFRGALRGSFNVAAFYNDFRNQQLSAGMTSSSGAPPNVGIINAGKSRIYGVEVESVIVPVKGLNLSLSYAYLNTLIQEVEAAQASGVYDYAYTLAYAGDRLPYAPLNKVSATASYRLPLNSKVGAVTVATTYTYQSAYSTDSSAPDIGGRSLLNANLTWNSVYGSPVDLGLFATNLTDKYYYTSINAGVDRFGWDSAYLGEPRMYGARVRVSFGQ
ncbi:MAG: TonB-dependent receptor [Solimonas sp.]